MRLAVSAARGSLMLNAWRRLSRALRAGIAGLLGLGGVLLSSSTCSDPPAPPAEAPRRPQASRPAADMPVSGSSARFRCLRAVLHPGANRHRAAANFVDHAFRHSRIRGSWREIGPNAQFRSSLPYHSSALHQIHLCHAQLTRFRRGGAMEMIFIRPIAHFTLHNDEGGIGHAYLDRILVVARRFRSTRRDRDRYGQQIPHSAAIFAEARSAASRDSSAMVAEARAMGFVR